VRRWVDTRYGLKNGTPAGNDVRLSAQRDRQRYEEALSIYRESGDVQGQGFTEQEIGNTYFNISRYEDAQPLRAGAGGTSKSRLSSRRGDDTPLPRHRIQFTRKVMLDGLHEGHPVVHIASHFSFNADSGWVTDFTP
jgi:hypothetical protein